MEAPVTLSCPVPCNEKWRFDVSISVVPLQASDLFMRVVPREGSRFVHRSVPPSTEVSYPGDGSANVRVFASNDEFERAVLLLETEGYRPTADDFQIEVKGGSGMPVEGAIANFGVNGPYFARVR